MDLGGIPQGRTECTEAQRVLLLLERSTPLRVPGTWSQGFHMAPGYLGPSWGALALGLSVPQGLPIIPPGGWPWTFYLWISLVNHIYTGWFRQGHYPGNELVEKKHISQWNLVMVNFQVQPDPTVWNDTDNLGWVVRGHCPGMVAHSLCELG